MTARSPAVAAIERRTHPVVCECEHEAHFATGFFDGPHPYGARVAEVVDVVTPHGTFKVCRACAATCHAVPSVQEPIPMTDHATVDRAWMPDPRLGRLAWVALASVRESGLNPRLAMDEAALDELTRSIAQEGIREPLLVRPVAEPGPAEGTVSVYQVADGHRRLRAAERAKCAEIPVRIRPMTDDEFRQEVALANLGRENLTPLEEAQAFASLLEGNGASPLCTVAELAARTGKTETFVYQRLKLRELRPDVRALLADGTLPLTHALLIARVPADYQRPALLGGVFGVGPMTLKDDDGKKPLAKLIPTIWPGTRPQPPAPLPEVRRWIEEHVHLSLKRAPFPTKDPELVPAAGSCVTCPKRTGYQPALFPELAAGRDECTDRACFQGKTEAHVARTIQEHKAQGVKLAKVTAGEVRGKADARRGEWKPAKPTAAGAVQAVHVADDKAGAVEWVTITRKPPKPRPTETRADDGKAPAAKPAKEVPTWENESYISDAIEAIVAERAKDKALHQEIASYAVAKLDPRVAVAWGYEVSRALDDWGLATPDKRQRITEPESSTGDLMRTWFAALREAGAIRGTFRFGNEAGDVTAAAGVLTFTAWYVCAAPTPDSLRKQAVAQLKAAAAAKDTPAAADTPKRRPVKKAAARKKGGAR